MTYSRILGSSAVIAFITTAALCSIPVMAADIGGVSYADIDERIAALESAVAHRGNRTVSLNLSGRVSQSLFFWDNGHERNVYELNTGSSVSLFHFSGKAKINEGLTAGYVIEIGVDHDTNTFVDESSDDNNPARPGGNRPPLSLRLSAWNISSKRLGTVWIGLYDGPSRWTVDLSDLSRTYSVNNAVYSALWNQNFHVFTKNGTDTGLSWGGTFGLDDFDIIRKNEIRYDTPNVKGFSASVAWGEDDFFDTAARWEGKLGDFSATVRLSYQRFSDGFDPQYRCTQGGPGNTSQLCTTYIAGAGFLHNPSGLFLSGAYGERHYERPDFPDSDFWRVKGGIKKGFISLGATSVYGEYYRANTGTTKGTAITPDSGISIIDKSSLNVVGAGIVQWINAAHMQLYAGYRNYSLDVKDAAGISARLSNFNAITAGAIINF